MSETLTNYQRSKTKFRKETLPILVLPMLTSKRSKLTRRPIKYVQATSSTEEIHKTIFLFENHLYLTAYTVHVHFFFSDLPSWISVCRFSRKILQRMLSGILQEYHWQHKLREMSWSDLYSRRRGNKYLQLQPRYVSLIFISISGPFTHNVCVYVCL